MQQRGYLGQTLENPDGATISSVSISQNSKLIASGSSEGIHVWSAATGSLEQTLKGSEYSSIAFSHDSRLIAAGWSAGGRPGDFKIKIWDATNGSLS
jgi:WD40 repeat protein